jgi:tRNA-binding EMAP/Myf-like protein
VSTRFRGGFSKVSGAVQKAGCVLPGSQQRVGHQKIKGIKSEGKICNAYEVGWVGEPTDELLLLQESWGIISGDICPMAPPSVCSIPFQQLPSTLPVCHAPLTNSVLPMIQSERDPTLLRLFYTTAIADLQRSSDTND